MAQKNNATCLICGKEYYVCLSCRDSIKANPWKTYTDVSEHYKVFQVVKGFYNGVYNKEEAKSKLKSINLDDLDSYRPHIKETINNILKEDKSTIEIVEKVEEPIESNVSTIEEIPVVEKTIVSRKRNYKVNNEVEEAE